MRFTLSAETEDAILDEIRRRFEGAELRIYDNAAPTSPNAPISEQRELAVLPFTEAALADGQMRATLDADRLAGNSGFATWARAYAKDGSPIGDCDVGEEGSGAAIELNTAGLRKGGPVVIRSFSLGVRR